MIRIVKTVTVLVVAATLCLPLASQVQTPQQTLQQYVADLQNNPNDTALREKIIALAQTMNPPPAIPPSAHQDYVMAVTFVESAKDNTGYEHAIDHFKSALLAAPWWMDAYKKLALAQKAAGHYDDAIATLNLYLLAKPADASDAQDEIYKLMALKQAAADEALRKQQEAQRAADEERQRQAQAEERRHQEEEEDFLRRLDGGRYICYHHGTSGGASMVWVYRLQIHGTTITGTSESPSGNITDIPGRWTISGRSVYALGPNGPMGSPYGEISEDGRTLIMGPDSFTRQY